MKSWKTSMSEVDQLCISWQRTNSRKGIDHGIRNMPKKALPHYVEDPSLLIHHKQESQVSEHLPAVKSAEKQTAGFLPLRAVHLQGCLLWYFSAKLSSTGLITPVSKCTSCTSSPIPTAARKRSCTVIPSTRRENSSSSKTLLLLMSIPASPDFLDNSAFPVPPKCISYIKWKVPNAVAKKIPFFILDGSFHLNRLSGQWWNYPFLH